MSRDGGGHEDSKRVGEKGYSSDGSERECHLWMAPFLFFLSR